MARTAKRPSRSKQPAAESLIHRGIGVAGAWVSENPTLVGGTTAFLIAMAFVSANAIWYQPHAHTSPLFTTRSFESFEATDRSVETGGTTIRLARPAAAPVPSARPQPAVNAASDPATKRVQSILKDLGYYAGEVDGISGPNTAAAISAYQRKMGLPASGRIDDTLLKELGAGDITGAIAASPEPAVAAAPTFSVERIQEGLRAFGKLDITVDGVPGRKTRAAIREFETLFGMAETGEPNAAVEQKMVAEGLLQ